MMKILRSVFVKNNDEMIVGMLRLFMECSSSQVQLAGDRGPTLGRELWARVNHLCIYFINSGWCHWTDDIPLEKNTEEESIEGKEKRAKSGLMGTISCKGEKRETFRAWLKTREENQGKYWTNQVSTVMCRQCEEVPTEKFIWGLHIA